ncbi:ALF repeat-containing protein [Paractinoplanes abujensis]|uniref:Methyl-accepting transducer domain-containing protein n=1 Tax=Paractinoplanes abujensis TaxID=882441 RepID=A0A7W7CYT7_9ACTN|nr:ALF repeat-containing protein [Actinoplanes abujensis]MBB4697172.1 hypothetical protein [Actinoplanes abujensis]
MRSAQRFRAAAMASLAAVIVGTHLHAPPAAAAPLPGRAAARAETDPPPVPDLPPLITETWNGTTGVSATDERWRKAVADVAEFTPEPEVRDAALAALAGGNPATILKFATVDKPALEKQIAARKKQEAADNLATIRAMAGTGGAYFNAEVQRVLAGTDSDRAAFLAYGAGIARDRDAQVARTAAERAATLRERVGLVAAAAPPESNVKRAAEAALAGDDAAITAFLATGYLTAARQDAAEREQYLKDLEARNKAAEELTDLAQRSERANVARRQMLVAHGEGVRALQRAANAMAATANAARHASRVLDGSGTAAQKATDLTTANNEAKRQLGYAQAAAREASIAAATASSAADVLIATGLEYGAEWSLIAQGMSEAATAAVGATQTAQFAIDATIATNNAETAQAKAEAHAAQAIKWRQHAEEHAKAAAKLAAAAVKQTAAAKTAAARAKKAREQAQAAEAKSWAQAEQTRRHREAAEAQAAEAKRQRQIAEAERATAARHRAEAERQAAVARNARANADAQAAVAASARSKAENSSAAAQAAAGRAWEKESEAGRARDAAVQAELDEQTAKAYAQAMRAGVAAAGSAAERDAAQREADAADRQVGVASGAARSARSSANTATGAAANARAAATQAQQAADRAAVAAKRARQAAAAADAAADSAEASARATHAARVRADAKAAVATAEETKAAEAARTAVRLSDQAAEEAVQALWAANRTRTEAEAATSEAVAAATQAEMAVRAATAARDSAAGIAEPANTAIAMVSPFTGADIDADFVALVAEQARTIGAEQAAAAQARAEEALTAAQRAEAAADRANAQVKPAFTAAAQAARSAADAAASAAEAKKYAAQAAADGAAARAAAAGAARADAQARADALAARQAANEAASDAAIAGRSAQQAQAEANAANSAASAAEADAAAARGAADRAESDAAATKRAADRAQSYADSAAAAASSALQHAVEAQQAAERAEEAERQRELDRRRELVEGTSSAPTGAERDELLAMLLGGEEDEYKQLEEMAGKDLLDYLKEAIPGLIDDLTPWGDIKGCFMERNWTACLSLALTFAPGGGLLKAGKMAKKLLEHAPKIKKFLDDVNKAKKRLEELKEKARKRKNPDEPQACPIRPNPAAAKGASRTAVAQGGGGWCMDDDERREYAPDIAGGHANGKHGSEFPGMSQADLEKLVDDVMANPSRTKDLGSGRKAYLGKDGRTIVIHDPMHPDGGTVFKGKSDPDAFEEYWEELN